LRNSVLNVVHGFAELVFGLGRLKCIYHFLGCRNGLCDLNDFRENSVLLAFYYAAVIDKRAYAKPLNFSATAFQEQLSSGAEK